MRILLVNKFYFPQGGADKHVLQLEAELRRRGHQVAIFAMAHPKNQPSEWSDYFVSEVDFSRVRLGWSGLRVIGRTLHSFEAARKMERLIQTFQPDVVHIHNIYHQISPSILPVIRRHRIPIVMTLHDYALVSANYNLYAHGGVCQHGQGGRYWEYVVHRCVKNSWLASLVAMIDQAWHGLRRSFEKNVTLYISPSMFLRQTVLSWIGRPLPIEVRPNFISTPPRHVWPKQPYVLYVGRLSEEKGVETLVRAAAMSQLQVKIAGTGPDEQKLRRLSQELGVQTIEWLGWQSGATLDALVAQAAAVVVPSRWYENCPLVILEAFAFGTPVIGAQMGGIPELVHDGYNGWLIPPDDPAALAAAINQITADPAAHARVSTGATASAKQYQLSSYMEQLEHLYAQALAR